MFKTLFAWIGHADLKAAGAMPSAGQDPGLGPIGQAMVSLDFDQAIFLSDHEARKVKTYLKWLKSHTEAGLEVHAVSLSSPMHFGEIYENVSRVLAEHLTKAAPDEERFYHLSPGTPAMTAVWIIAAKTRFPATLLESSIQEGVQVASVPFDISADYLPDLLRKPDEELQRLSQGLPPEAPEFGDIIHRCAAMRHLVARARRVAPRNVPVLILGESGTGKELLARAIHRASTFASGPFVAVNCGAIPAALVEAELFGHEKGAFTGAGTARKGYIEESSGGTLFLDEVGELPRETQVKLLRVLQEFEVTPVGASKPRRVHFRLITATNRDLFRDVSENSFREDLFHRIAVAILQVPPLRERDGDIGLLVDTLLEKVNLEAQGQPGFEHKGLSVSARNLLINHPWPGNIRELMNTLQRAAVWSPGPLIDRSDIEEALLNFLAKTGEGILNRPLANGLCLQDIVAEVSRHYLSRAMEESGGNKTIAARLLGLPSYQTLTNWLKRYGLEA
jgi:transcriptional regulator with GAF, ATPase, and Fis domain